jgi:ATP-dependent DNA ligase
MYVRPCLPSAANQPPRGPGRAAGVRLRREPFEVRKATLASVLRKAGFGLQLNEHLEQDDGGDVVFRHACKMGLEGIVEAARLALPLGPLA